MVPVRLQWSALTHPGSHRKNNEDAFVAITFDGQQTHYLGKIGQAPLTTADFLFAVSDGMGGANSGEFASRMAVDRITRLLPRRFRLAAGGINTGFEDLLTEMIESIHRDLLRLGQSYEECSGMGATLSLCWFTPGWMYFAHVGDSRVYYLPAGGKMTQATRDHSQVGWMRRNGKISEREARLHPARHSLQQALGAGHQFINPHIGAVGLEPGDRFLICSDGIVDGLWDWQIEEMLAPPCSIEDLAPALVHRALENSGRDNTTAVVVEVQTGDK